MDIGGKEAFFSWRGRSVHTPSGLEAVDGACIPTWNRLEWRPSSVYGVEPTPQLHVDSRSRPWLCRLHQFALNLPETNNGHRAAADCLQSPGSSPAHSLMLLVQLAVLICPDQSTRSLFFLLLLQIFFFILDLTVSLWNILIFAELKEKIKRSMIGPKIIIKKSW